MASSFAWLLLLALALPTLVHSAATSSDKATHDGLRKLTAANFTLTNQGAWLIEFFSPNCVHCKRFGATWSELSQNKDNLRTQYPQAPFTLAQVDCLAQWDLCKEQGVTFLPRLTIYQDGKQHDEEYKGDRNYVEISAYIDKFAKEYRQSKGVEDLPADVKVDANATLTQNGTAASSASAADGQTTAVTPITSATDSATSTAASSTTAVEAITEILPSGPNPKGELLSYGSAPISTKEDLKAWLDGSAGQGPTFVKFFAPWCPHCKAMAAAFKQLSSSLKGRVNTLEVDCEANQALCRSYDIRGYPVLRLYDQGNVKEYTGGRNHDAMLKWVLKGVSAAGLKPVSDSTELAALARDNEVLFLYLHSAGTPKEEVKAVEAAASVLFGGRVPIFASSEQALLDRYSSSLAQDRFTVSPAKSGLLVFKDHSVLEPTAVMYPSTLRNTDDTGKASYSEDAQLKLSHFLSREKYALVTELTAANFEETIKNPEDAFVVLAALSDTHHGGQLSETSAEGIAMKDAEIATLRSVALEWRTKKAERAPRQVIFAWIDADRWKSQLSKLYDIKSNNVPAVVLVDGNKLQFYSMDGAASEGGQEWISASTTFDAIDRVFLGKTAARSSKSLLQKSMMGAGNGLNVFIDLCIEHPFLAFGGLFGMLGMMMFCLGRGRKREERTLPLYSKVSTVKAD